MSTEAKTDILSVVIFARSKLYFQKCCSRNCVKNTKNAPQKDKKMPTNKNIGWNKLIFQFACTNLKILRKIGKILRGHMSMCLGHLETLSWNNFHMFLLVQLSLCKKLECQEINKKKCSKSYQSFFYCTMKQVEQNPSRANNADSQHFYI